MGQEVSGSTSEGAIYTLTVPEEGTYQIEINATSSWPLQANFYSAGAYTNEADVASAKDLTTVVVPGSPVVETLGTLPAGREVTISLDTIFYLEYLDEANSKGTFVPQGGFGEGEEDPKDTAYKRSALYNRNMGFTFKVTKAKGDVQVHDTCALGDELHDKVTFSAMELENNTSVADHNYSLRNWRIMWRMYNPNSGEHFYTADASERDHLYGLGWHCEGMGWLAPKASGSPDVYRLYNPNAGEHHYTMAASERDALVSVGWNYEGVGWQSDAAKSVPLYRQYNPNAFSCNHNYTTSKGENDLLVGLGWRYEGIGWYGMV